MALKFEVGKRYVDRAGRVHRVVCTDVKGLHDVLSLVCEDGVDEEQWFHSTKVDTDELEDDEPSYKLIAEYHEPQPPRKLFAYTVRAPDGLNERVDWFTAELHTSGYSRAPEYDITIPD